MGTVFESLSLPVVTAPTPPPLGPSTGTQKLKSSGGPWIVAVSVMLATFMEVLDTAIASVALPYIDAVALRDRVDELILNYSLCLHGFHLLWSRSDLSGHTPGGRGRWLLPRRTGCVFGGTFRGSRNPKGVCWRIARLLRTRFLMQTRQNPVRRWAWPALSRGA
jgi:hypothetical protein